jgi:chemotaxis signal transduction protein
MTDLDRGKCSQATTAYDLLPQGDYAQKVMQERARYLATENHHVQQQEGIRYILLKQNEHGLYGIPYVDTKQVLHNIHITTIPNVASPIQGVFNWRGKLLTAIDLNQLLQLPQVEAKASPYVIVIANKQYTMGLMVADIIGSDHYLNDKLEIPSFISHLPHADYIHGLHLGNRVILNINAIMAGIYHLNLAKVL